MQASHARPPEPSRVCSLGQRHRLSSVASRPVDLSAPCSLFPSPSSPAEERGNTIHSLSLQPDGRKRKMRCGFGCVRALDYGTYGRACFASSHTRRLCFD